MADAIATMLSIKNPCYGGIQSILGQSRGIDLVYNSVSQPLNHWHLGPDSSVLGGGAVLCVVGCSAASLTSTQ